MTGAEVLGEGIVFGIAAFVLLVENRRAAANEVCCWLSCSDQFWVKVLLFSSLPQARKASNIKIQFEMQQKRIEELEVCCRRSFLLVRYLSFT